VTADDIKALVERLRDPDAPFACASVLDTLTEDAAMALEILRAENQRLRLEFRADCEKQAEELFAVQADAARWRAFINCARIRLFGWAGYGSTKGGQVREPDSNGYRHFGGEFWTIYDAPSDPMAQEILTGFADAAVAIDAARSQSDKEKP
jgi:hypothetical protein